MSFSFTMYAYLKWQSMIELIRTQDEVGDETVSVIIVGMLLHILFTSAVFGYILCN
uniref:Uncharacterized protein n=1 Tax=Nelumbo nucifera TaxID=4432 RepID=A0A822Y8C3_NELNU|nr:TPA_asm: hypothetical protein HUJ06_029990 [Nelumbo nucifera]